MKGNRITFRLYCIEKWVWKETTEAVWQIGGRHESNTLNYWGGLANLQSSEWRTGVLRRDEGLENRSLVAIQRSLLLALFSNMDCWAGD